MKLVGLDTNALLAFRLARKPYYEEVKKVLEGCLTHKFEVFIPDPVFLEIEWVLRSYYKEEPKKIIEFFSELLLLDGLRTNHKELMKLSVNLYDQDTHVSFTDCVIAMHMLKSEVDEFLTYDKDLKKLYSALSSPKTLH